MYKKCTIEDVHCHDKNDMCISFIEDCESHYYQCSYSCHEECACQNP